MRKLFPARLPVRPSPAQGVVFILATLSSVALAIAAVMLAGVLAALLLLCLCLFAGVRASVDGAVAAVKRPLAALANDLGGLFLLAVAAAALMFLVGPAKAGGLLVVAAAALGVLAGLAKAGALLFCGRPQKPSTSPSSTRRLRALR